MEPSQHPDPLEEALSAGAQRVAQLASLVAAAAQVYMQRRALRGARHAIGDDERATRILREQDRLAEREARLSWMRAHDSDWLAHADLEQAGRAWASAVGYADTEPAAASAMRRCEDRLRALHPFAMARYDRLRDDGMDPLDAMRETVPLFARSPTARPGDVAPARLALPATVSGNLPSLDRQAPDDPAGPGSDPSPRELTETRGRQIADRLQARALASGRPALDPDELTIVLETVTNLPDETIATIARQATRADRTGADHSSAAVLATTTGNDRGRNLAPAGPSAEPASTPPTPSTVGRSPAELAGDSFPHTAADAVRAAATKGARPVDNPSPVSTANVARLARRPARPV